MSVDDTTDAPTKGRPTGSSARIAIGEIVEVAHGVIHCRVGGWVRLDTLERIIGAAEEQLRKGYRPRIFIDSADAERYDVDVRKVFQDWVTSNRSRIEGVWVLHLSPLIKIGTSLASAFTGGAFRGYDKWDDFQKALEVAMREAEDAARPT